MERNTINWATKDDNKKKEKRKKESEEKKKDENSFAKKKSKFWLMRMRQEKNMGLNYIQLAGK